MRYLVAEKANPNPDDEITSKQQASEYPHDQTMLTITNGKPSI